MTQNRLPDRWSTRDFPVLLETARQLDEGAMPAQVATIAEALQMDEHDVISALKALASSYVVGRSIDTLGGTVDFFVTDLTERGRRAVGLWPSGESADALVDALRQAEDLVEDPEEKNLLRRAAGAVGSVSRDVMVDVVAAVVARQSGIG